jgi:hypothetical protein
VYDAKKKIPGDHICKKCDRGFWTLHQRQKGTANWVVHACVFCIDNNAAKVTEEAYLRVWKEHRSTEVLDAYFVFDNNALTQNARFQARIRYLTEE